MKSGLKPHRLNNLTKTLGFNIYDVYYAETSEDLQAYMQYTDEEYGTGRLTQILTDVVDIIDANILSIARQDYDSQGTSVTTLISEQLATPAGSQIGESPSLPPDTTLAHLDRSHVIVYTCPEIHPVGGIATFRVDIDMFTCGVVSPLKTLNYLIHQFDSGIVMTDYRVRGLIHDIEGRKHFTDHEINSIQNYLSDDTHETYQITDVNVYQENLFHTKMLLKNFELESYLLGDAIRTLSTGQREQVMERLRHEILETLYARNMPR